METQRVICIGDIHGHLKKLEGLWENLRNHLGDEELDKAVIVFLGDLCDRGPDTKGVLDWIIELQNKRAAKKKQTQENQENQENETSKRQWEEGDVVVLTGNHDFGFSTFVASSPFDFVPEKEIEKTKNPGYFSGYFTPPVDGGMHYVGRRWGGSQRYSAAMTFNSYGCEFEWTEEARDNIIAAIPPSHHNFLKNLDWVYDIEVPWGPGRLICLHAGLPDLKKKKLELYLEAMKKRDVMNEILQHHEFGYLDCLSGRGNVIRCPQSLLGEAVVVSGHHGTNVIKKGRAIIDTSGGRAGIPLEGLIFPECDLVRSDDSPVEKVTGLFE